MISNYKKLIQRFVKDYNLPINIYNEEMINYYMGLYDFFPKKVYFNIIDTIETKYDGNVEKWLDYCGEVRDRAIDKIKNTPEYREFNECDLKQYDIPKNNYRERLCYTEETNGKNFMSVDMKKANFQALRYVGVIKDDTYEEFIKSVGGDDYISGSKYLRQVILGNCNPSRQIKVEKFLMDNVLNHLLEIYPYYKVFSVNADEIVFSLVDDIYCGPGSGEYLENHIKKQLSVDVRVEFVKTMKLDIVNCNGDNVDAYVKKDLVSGKETLKKVSTLFYPQVYKLYKGMDITEKDRRVFVENQIATFSENLRWHEH